MVSIHHFPSTSVSMHDNLIAGFFSGIRTLRHQGASLTFKENLNPLQGSQDNTQADMHRETETVVRVQWCRRSKETER